MEIPPELQESEEDRMLDEREAERDRKFDKVMNIAWIVLFVLFGAALAYLILRNIF